MIHRASSDSYHADTDLLRLLSDQSSPVQPADPAVFLRSMQHFSVLHQTSEIPRLPTYLLNKQRPPPHLRSHTVPFQEFLSIILQ